MSIGPFKPFKRGGKLQILSNPTIGWNHPEHHIVSEAAMPSDDEMYDIENVPPGIIGVRWIDRTPGRASMFERIGVEWRRRGSTVLAPFWVCVLDRVCHGRSYYVLRHAHLFPEWRAAAMSVFRLAGARKLGEWIETQREEGEFENSRSRLRRQRQRQRKQQKKERTA